MKARDLRCLVAYHEAGHAVIAHKFDLAAREIDMVANEDYGANVQTHSAVWVSDGDFSPSARRTAW